MIALIGLVMIIATSLLALSRKTHLMVPFIVIPVIFGMLSGFSFKDVMGFAATGVSATFTSVLMCVFAVLYFSILSETGMFDIIVNKLVSITKGNIYVVMIVTIVVAFIGHLDGAFNTTFLIAIPALAPLYRKLKMDPRLLILLVALAAAPMCAVAWGSPVKMVVYDPKINPVLMSQMLYPAMGTMFLLAIVYALCWGHYYSKKNASEIALLRASFTTEDGKNHKADLSALPFAKPQYFWINFVLFVFSVVCFVTITNVQTYLLFMLFSALALMINYHDGDTQGKIVKKYSSTMLAPGILFMGIGVMVGILNGTGMVKEMVKIMMSVVPQSMARYTHVIWYFVSMPLQVFVPYQAFQSINPLLLGIGSACGLTSYQVLGISQIPYVNPASPLVAANNLAAELGGVDIIDLAKFSFLTCFGFTILNAIVCVIFGLV
jgi:H+/citrate symporter